MLAPNFANLHLDSHEFYAGIFLQHLYSQCFTTTAISLCEEQRTSCVDNEGFKKDPLCLEASVLKPSQQYGPQFSLLSNSFWRSSLPTWKIVQSMATFASDFEHQGNRLILQPQRLLHVSYEPSNKMWDGMGWEVCCSKMRFNICCLGILQ